MVAEQSGAWRPSRRTTFGRRWLACAVENRDPQSRLLLGWAHSSKIGASGAEPHQFQPPRCGRLSEHQRCSVLERPVPAATAPSPRTTPFSSSLCEATARQGIRCPSSGHFAHVCPEGACPEAYA
jgi:hypothetical protein